MGSELVEVEVCRCGLSMKMNDKHPWAGYCPNCDRVQPQESVIDPDTGMLRKRMNTIFDQNYTRAVLLQEKAWYPEGSA
jgi:hypothetical protein